MRCEGRRDEVLFILAKARLLVQQLHQLGYLHWDLTEENIVYDKETQDVRLIDFGLSIAIESADIASCIQELYEGAPYAGPISQDIDYVKRLELGSLAFLEAQANKPWYPYKS